MRSWVSLCFFNYFLQFLNFMFQSIYFQVLNSFVVFSPNVETSSFGRFLPRCPKLRFSRPYNKIIYEIESLVELTIRTESRIGSPQRIRNPIRSGQTSDQISFPEVVIASEFAPWKAVFWNGCHTDTVILYGQYCILYMYWQYIMISAKSSLLTENCQKATQLLRIHTLCYIVYVHLGWKLCLTQTFVWMAWSNLFSISCSIKCRLDGSIIFPCWWWVKAIYIFINYDYLSYQFCDSWTYPMFDTVRFRVSRTGPCPCPSISDNNYALIESNDKTKIFLYSWRREPHFQPFLWICPKSQGPLMF